MNNELILIVEDEEKIAKILIDYLAPSSFRTHWIAHGADVAEWMKNNRPDAILLDTMLPGRSGLEICRKIRSESSVPIMMLTSRVEESDRLAGFSAGADDYVCKPFSPREVVARTHALLRRATGGLHVPTNKGLSLNKYSYTAGANGREVTLTALEFHILEVLSGATGRIFTRNEIMDRVYSDYRIINDRTIDSHVKKLRRKLNLLELEVQPVRSVYGVGYKYEE